MNKQFNVADYIVRRRAREGITDCFFLPRGSPEVDIPAGRKPATLSNVNEKKSASSITDPSVADRASRWHG